MPGNLLCCHIMKLKNLQDISIKDTKISLPQLAKVLEICKNITNLDFSYKHETGLFKALYDSSFSTPEVIAAFKKLTSLKVATSVLDAKDYFNDPWGFITKILRRNRLFFQLFKKQIRQLNIFRIFCAAGAGIVLSSELKLRTRVTTVRFNQQ